jgi:hypothetical protein
LVNHRGPYSLTPHCPLSPQEIDWLKVKGIEKKAVTEIDGISYGGGSSGVPSWNDDRTSSPSGGKVTSYP